MKKTVINISSSRSTHLSETDSKLGTHTKNVINYNFLSLRPQKK